MGKHNLTGEANFEDHHVLPRMRGINRDLPEKYLFPLVISSEASPLLETDDCCYTCEVQDEEHASEYMMLRSSTLQSMTEQETLS